MVRASSGNQILPIPNIIQENISREFLSVAWQDITFISGFVVDDQANVSSEEAP